MPLGLLRPHHPRRRGRPHRVPRPRAPHQQLTRTLDRDLAVRAIRVDRDDRKRTDLPRLERRLQHLRRPARPRDHPALPSDDSAVTSRRECRHRRGRRSGRTWSPAGQSPRGRRDIEPIAEARDFDIRGPYQRFLGLVQVANIDHHDPACRQRNLLSRRLPATPASTTRPRPPPASRPASPRARSAAC